MGGTTWWIEGASLAHIYSGSHAALWGPGLETGHLWTLQPRPSPHPHKTTGKEKSQAQPPLPAASWKTSRTCLMGLKSAGGFFSPPSETIRPGAVKGPKTQRQIQREIGRLTPTLKLGQISLCCPIELACYFLFLLLFIIFHYFYFFSFLF